MWYEIDEKNALISLNTVFILIKNGHMFDI